MIRKSLFFIAMVLVCISHIKAVPIPPKPSVNRTEDFDPKDSVTGFVAPATLLLLGLAGGFTGVKIYRNNKKEK